MTWTTRAAQVWLLYRDGEVIRDTDGRPRFYLSRDSAEFVASHWDEFRAPTYDELQAMSEPQLLEKMRRLQLLEEEALL